MERAMKERLHTIAAVIALVASGPTLTISVGNLSGYLSDDWAIYALILMGFFGLPASAYLVTSYWRESNIIVIDEAPSGPSGVSGRTKLRLVSAHRGRTSRTATPCEDGAF
jgi:hypothetical protein